MPNAQTTPTTQTAQPDSLGSPPPAPGSNRNKTKHPLLFALGALLLLAVIALLLLRPLQNAKKRAAAQYAAGRYAEAVDTYLALLDSDRLLASCFRADAAEGLLRSAEALFDADRAGYLQLSDSGRLQVVQDALLANEADPQPLVNAALYGEAERLEAAGDARAAQAIYASLADYADAAEASLRCAETDRLNRANEAFSGDDFVLAFAILAEDVESEAARALLEVLREEKPARLDALTARWQNRVVFAMTGDYYTFAYNPDDIQIRRGLIHRDAEQERSFAFFPDGSMRIIDLKTTFAEELFAQGIRDSWTFGPVLIENGAANDISGHPLSYNDVTLRSAVASLGPHHHIGFTSGYGTLAEVTDELLSYGAVCAYNLDGGRSVSMAFMGEAINYTYYDNLGVRRLQDMVGFIESELVPMPADRYLSRRW